VGLDVGDAGHIDEDACLMGGSRLRYPGRRQAKFETRSSGEAFAQGEFAAMGAHDFAGEAKS
jgi:hypothetical protein